MYFKIDTNTPTGQKLTELWNRMQECEDKTRELIKELGGTRFVSFRDTLAGGFGGIQLAEKPEYWKKVYSHHTGDYYFPKALPRHKALFARIHALPTISKLELNQIVGFKVQTAGMYLIRNVGFHFGEEYHLLKIAEESQFTPNEDMVELTQSQYKALEAELDSKPEPANV